MKIPDASEDLDIEEYEKEYWDETGEEESEPVDIEPGVRKILVNCNIAHDVNHSLCICRIIEISKLAWPFSSHLDMLDQLV